MRRTSVAAPSGVSVISTLLEPGGTGEPSFSQPQVKTTRRGGSSTTYSPRATSVPLRSQRYRPPGRGSSSAVMPFQSTSFAGSVKNGKIVSGLASMRTSETTTSGSAVVCV